METKNGRKDAPIYALGRSEEERRRLIEQDAFLGGFTGRLFREAGISPGMRVLDVGCGVGDVSLLAASLVGPEGEVVGVDTDPDAVVRARDRVHAMGLSNASFVAGDVRELVPDRPFDAVVGRFVLMYQADPAGVLRGIAEHVRPGGIFAFHEWMLSDRFLSHPHSPLWQSTSNIGLETVRRAGTQMRIGIGLYQAYAAAGLRTAGTIAERPVGGGPDYPGYGYLVGLIRSMLPVTQRLGVATAQEIDVETLEDRIRDEVVALGGVVSFPSMMGAWARKTVSASGLATRTSINQLAG